MRSSRKLFDLDHNLSLQDVIPRHRLTSILIPGIQREFSAIISARSTQTQDCLIAWNREKRRRLPREVDDDVRSVPPETLGELGIKMHVIYPTLDAGYSSQYRSCRQWPSYASRVIRGLLII